MNSLVYRARQAGDDKPVVLKIVNNPSPSPERIVRLRREYMITHSLNLPGVIRSHEYVETRASHAIVLEDFGGESLASLDLAGKLDPERFLTLAITITGILEQIHGQNIIHKDINPSNILLNPSTGEVRLIDFCIAATLTTEQQGFRNPNALEGTLQYISPEQTGRMNRPIDYRTDYYSLGVTFYELLSGVLPFQDNDLLSLVYSHIARIPKPLHQLDTNIPPVLSDVIIKLMAKNVEDRYQSTSGLIKDLERCLSDFQIEGQITAFPVGQQDISSRFQLPQKLYGREREIKRLTEIFGSSANTGEPTESQVPTGAKIILIAGPPGVGKTALVQEIFKLLTHERGCYSSGKFDQFRRNIPHYALIQALKTLVQQLLMENQEHLDAWRQRLQHALGANAQLLVDVIPDLALIIGLQPAVEELPSDQARIRNQMLFSAFVHTFAQSGRPLVLFLDDLQWIDADSLNLLKFLANDPEQQKLLIIGAYRDAEVFSTHPLMDALQDIQNKGGFVDLIPLASLDLPNISALVRDTFHCDIQRARELAKLVFTKTGGNPFFIGEFLKFVNAQEFIRFTSNQWDWDLPQIKAQNISNNIVELLTGNILQLSLETRQVLIRAAFLGDVFSLQILAAVCDQTVAETAAVLGQAIEKGLVFPLDDEYKFVAFTGSESDIQLHANCKFAHDRIRQAAYDLIPAEERPAVHLDIGYLLWRHYSSDEKIEHIFDIVNHLNQGVNLLEDRSDRLELAELNLQAGHKAKRSAAFEAAFDYYKKGITLLDETSWDDHYNLALALHNQAMITALSCTAYEEIDPFAEEVIEHAGKLEDETELHLTKTQLHLIQGRHLEALDYALGFLKRLGVDLPSRPTQGDVERKQEQVQTLLGKRKIEDLLELPLMTDPEKRGAMHMLSGMTVAAFNAVPKLYSLISFERVRLSMQYGNMELSPAGYASYGLYLCGLPDGIEKGYRFSKLALDLLNRLNARQFKARTLNTVHAYVSHWKVHLRSTISPLLEAYRSGLETGDLAFSTGNLFFVACHSYFCSKNLRELDDEVSTFIEVLDRLRHWNISFFIRLYHQVILNLIGNSETPWVLNGKSYREKESLPVHQATNDNYILWHFYNNKLILCYLFQRYDEGLEHAVAAESVLGHAGNGYLVAVYYFYDSLVRLAITDYGSEAEKGRHMQRVEENQQKMKRWAQHAPMNFLHKYHLVEAELARVQDSAGDAREHYDQAIALAEEHQYIQEKALACELAAEFYFSREQVRLAYFYLEDALNAYHQWGAQAKVADLLERYPQLKASTNLQLSSTDTLPASSTSRGSFSSLLDLDSILQASQALSSEIVLSKLVTRLMEIIFASAGAQRGFLILEKDSDWFVQAGGDADTDEERIILSTPLNAVSNSENPAALSTAIVNYVIHTKERLVLNDAAREGPFMHETYVQTFQAKSILCMPLLKQSKLVGVLYLENNLASGAFTKDRLALLDALSGQAVISIENASFYDLLEQKVQERTVELEAEVVRRTQAEEQMRQLVITDSLTGVFNRRHIFNLLEDEFQRAVRYKTIFSVIIFDLDHFKQINDIFGHLVGDQVLQETVKASKVAIRRNDVLARYGGEEFIVLLPETERKKCSRVAERIRLAIEEISVHTSTDIVRVTASLGVASFDSEKDTAIEKLLDRADQALYRSKQDGRNRVSVFREP